MDSPSFIPKFDTENLIPKYESTKNTNIHTLILRFESVKSSEYFCQDIYVQFFYLNTDKI